MKTSFLDKDDDGHWYIIPANKRQEWEDWTDTGSDDVPSFAEPVGGNPDQVEFVTIEDFSELVDKYEELEWVMNGLQK